MRPVADDVIKLPGEWLKLNSIRSGFWVKMQMEAKRNWYARRGLIRKPYQRKRRGRTDGKKKSNLDWEI